MFAMRQQGAAAMRMSSHLLFHSQTGSLALAHNGNLVNANLLKHQLEAQGSIFQTSSDTEVLAHLMKRSGYSELKGPSEKCPFDVKRSLCLFDHDGNRINGCP